MPPPRLRSTVWSATLTAGEARVGGIVTNVGYDRTFGLTLGSLSDNSFDLAGTTYTVTSVGIAFPANVLGLALDTGLPANVHPQLTLHIGSDSFALAGVGIGTGGNVFQWSGHGLSWSNNDVISVSLTSPPQRASRSRSRR